MKLQRSTWILILLAVLLGGIVYIYEIEGRPQREVAKNEKQKIFTFAENDVQSVTVKTKEQTLLFERNSQQTSIKSAQPKWLMTVLERAKVTPAPKPPEAVKTVPNQNPSPDANKTPQAQPSAPPKENLTKIPANEAYVSFLLDQLVKGSGDRITADPRIDYGLNQPQATIDVKLNNGKLHQLILGKSNFNKSSVYALADATTSASQSPQILLVSTNFENAVNRPLSEWKQSQDKKG